jgi:TadE-like protein
MLCNGEFHRLPQAPCSFSFPGSAWVRSDCEALPRQATSCQAETGGQCIPRQSLGTSHRQGSVLLEFAVIALVLYFLLAATLELGRAIYCAQAVNQAADVASRELSAMPFPAATTFQQALADPTFKKRIYDDQYLVIDLGSLGSQSLDDYFAALPLVNQQLRTVMIVEQVGGRQLLRYPGALLTNSATASGFSVGVPLVVSRGSDGTETIEWVPVIEEVTPGAFVFSASDLNSGRVSLRINYPFQAAALSSYHQSTTGPHNVPNKANDAGVTVDANPSGFTPPGTTGADTNTTGVYAGAYGLGSFYALGQQVRPYRVLLSEQSGSYQRKLIEP